MVHILPSCKYTYALARTYMKMYMLFFRQRFSSNDAVWRNERQDRLDLDYDPAGLRAVTDPAVYGVYISPAARVT